MPIYTRETLQTDQLPWVDIDDFEFIVLGRSAGSSNARPAPAEREPPTATPPTGARTRSRPTRTSRELKPTTPRERLIVVIDGEVQVECELRSLHLTRRDYFDVPRSGATVTNIGKSTAELARIAGPLGRRSSATRSACSDRTARATTTTTTATSTGWCSAGTSR